MSISRTATTTSGLRFGGACSIVCTLGMLAAACSAPETHSQLGASDTAALITGSMNAKPADATTAAAKPTTTQALASATGVAGSGACPAGKAPTQAQTLRNLDQRCTKLREEGEVWQRTRKLAVLNRGEAGGRMADLHTPWTKEVMAFYVDHCSPSHQKGRAQQLNKLDPTKLAGSCG